MFLLFAEKEILSPTQWLERCFRDIKRYLYIRISSENWEDKFQAHRVKDLEMGGTGEICREEKIRREERMAIMEDVRLCPVCGERVIGRSDKRYCSDSCRIFAANRRGSDARKRLRESDAVGSINRNLKAMEGERGGRYIKFIALVTRVCKILYKFGG